MSSSGSECEAGLRRVKAIDGGSFELLGVGAVQHTRPLALPSAEGQAGRDGGRGDAGSDDEPADNVRRRLARSPCLERADGQRVAKRAVSEILRDEPEVRIGR